VQLSEGVERRRGEARKPNEIRLIEFREVTLEPVRYLDEAVSASEPISAVDLSPDDATARGRGRPSDAIRDPGESH
jgi:hypothetical protein